MAVYSRFSRFTQSALLNPLRETEAVLGSHPFAPGRLAAYAQSKARPLEHYTKPEQLGAFSEVCPDQVPDPIYTA